jgi:ATP-binding cassette, subfamily F, member 3
MIQFSNLRLARGAKVLFDQASLQIHPGWRVGLTGANGSGKSSLFALLRHQLHADKGDCFMPSGWRIAHVAQETPALSRPAIDYVMDGDTSLREAEAELAKAESLEDGEAIGHAHAKLHEIGAYSATARARALLDGLGFSGPDMERPVASFSGGWRMRLNLAQALMCPSDLLLLDEPTNHLDLDAVLWLEQWLCAYPGTLLLISHDRDFLDACTTHTLHLEHERLLLYSGSYSSFERTRAERLAQQQAFFERQQREIAHIEDYIRRFRAKATKARQAQSRIKALERMERVAAAHVDSPFSFAFKSPPKAPDPLLRLEAVELGYPGHENPIFSDLNLVIRPGQRIGLLGRNGAGKSTLIKLLEGSLPLRHGERVPGKGLCCGYFAQHQLEILREEDSALTHLMRLAPQTREQDLRDYLGGFDFRGDNHGSGRSVTDPCRHFSGGEKARLALALLIWQNPNLLLLDEPTNHLDLDMRHALTCALQDYEGAVILVSHDRALLASTCEQFWLVDEGHVRIFEGDLEDYRQWLAQKRQETADRLQCPQTQAERKNRQETREKDKAQRQATLLARRPLVKEQAEVEKRLSHNQAEKAALDARLSDGALYATAPAPEIAGWLKEQARLLGEIEALEIRWLEISEALDVLGTP